MWKLEAFSEYTVLVPPPPYHHPAGTGGKLGAISPGPCEAEHTVWRWMAAN